MTSQDQEFFTLYFDAVNNRITRIESRVQELQAGITQLQGQVKDIQAEQRVIINRIDVQDRLIWGGISWVTFIVTFLMFMQSIFKREKSESKSESESRNVFTVEAVKELLNIFRSENK